MDKLRKTMKIIAITLTLLFAFFPALSAATEKADFVYVVKSKSKLFLSKNGKILKSFDVAFGSNPKGHKQQEGDNRTPEGLYSLDYKKLNSDFHRAIQISYPNREDRRRARALGLKPGGSIMIHGQKKGFEHLTQITQEYDWTDGCIAVSNSDVEEIWAAIEIPTPIRIMP